MLRRLPPQIGPALALIPALLVCVGLALGLPASSALGQAPPAPGATGAGTVLGPGDVVLIEVWRQAELSGQFTIALDGTISHPLYRELRVAGLPMDEVESLVRVFLEGLEASPRFVVQPLFRVQIGGEVRAPNIYVIAPEVTLAQAIWLAGGPAERGRLDRVSLLRDGRETVLDLRRAAAAPVYLQSGDEIIMARRGSFFRDYVVPFSSVFTATYSVLRIVKVIR